MKIAETNTTIGALIERLEQTGKPLATKVRAFILIEDDEPDQSREDIREAVERFRMGFKDIPSEDRVGDCRIQTGGAKEHRRHRWVVIGSSNWDLDG